MTDPLDDRLRDLGARWRDHVEETPGRPHRDLTWLAAAVVVVVALGATLWLTRDVGDEDPGPSPATPPPTTGAVVPWAPLDPGDPELGTATAEALDHIHVRSDLDIVVAGREQLPFTVTLTSDTRVSLSPCPDYQVSLLNSWDDRAVESHALNCADVPFKDGEGVPYLPAGEPVTFAMRMAAPSTSVEVFWSLVTGGEPDHARGRLLALRSVSDVPGTAAYCTHLSFEGDDYQLATEQAAALGERLGTGNGTACGSGGDATVEVHRAAEVYPDGSVAVRYEATIVHYLPVTADLAPPRWFDYPAAPVTEGDSRTAGAMLALALDPAAADLEDFAPDVQAGVGTDLAPVSRDALADPATWTFELDGFAGGAGTVNVLDLLREQLIVSSQVLWNADNEDLVLTVGDHARCAGPPGPTPPGLEGLRHLGIQPSEKTIDSCLQWFAIDLYLDDTGQIAAVSLDLWEP